MALTKTGTDGIKDDAVTLDKLAHGTSGQDGKFLRANNGAAPSFESLPASGLSNVVEDTTPQLGGNLDIQSNDITGSGNLDLEDAGKIKLGTGDDLTIYHDPTSNDSFIKEEGSGALKVCSNLFRANNAANTEAMIKAEENGAVELYHDASKKIETTSGGIKVSDADTTVSAEFHDTNGVTGYVHGAGTNFGLCDKSFNWKVKLYENAQVELYHNTSKKLETTSDGVEAAKVSCFANDYPTFRLWDDAKSDNFVLRYENSTQRVQLINNHNGMYIDRGGTGISAYSDERGKDIVSNITGGFEKVKGLRTVIGNYKDDPDKYQKPFLIAQDVQKVLPQAVSTRNPDNLGLNYTDVIPLLTNALQEAIAKIEILETKVAALEAA